MMHLLFENTFLETCNNIRMQKNKELDKGSSKSFAELIK